MRWTMNKYNHQKYEYEKRSMRWTMNKYNHDARTQSPRLTATRLQLAVGRRGLGPGEQGEQRAQRAPFVATDHARVHTEQQLTCWARMLLKKNTT